MRVSKQRPYITTQCQTPIFCTPLSSTTPTRLQQVAGSNVGRYISEFQHGLQGIYTRTARMIYPVDYVKTYSSKSTIYRTISVVEERREILFCLILHSHTRAYFI